MGAHNTHVVAPLSGELVALTHVVFDPKDSRREHLTLAGWDGTSLARILRGRELADTLRPAITVGLKWEGEQEGA
jgi:hypothetical protein